MKHKKTRNQRKEIAKESWALHHNYNINLSKRKQKSRFLYRHRSKINKCKNEDQIEEVLTKEFEKENIRKS